MKKRGMRNKNNNLIFSLALILIVAVVKIFFFSPPKADTIGEVPQFKGSPYVEINDNVPQFDKDNLPKKSFEKYSELDELGRCGEAYANIGKDIMPGAKRESISSVRPSGWQNKKYYGLIKDTYLYNRCHLIGFQLSGENANPKNLITGTRYLNVEGMLPFEEKVSNYIKRTGKRVLYRVRPIFKGNELVARGVQMEAMSVEDKGESVSFNVFVYNSQPGVEIDYKTGKSRKAEE